MSTPRMPLILQAAVTEPSWGEIFDDNISLLRIGHLDALQKEPVAIMLLAFGDTDDICYQLKQSVELTGSRTSSTHYDAKYFEDILRANLSFFTDLATVRPITISMPLADSIDNIHEVTREYNETCIFSLLTYPFISATVTVVSWKEVTIDGKTLDVPSVDISFWVTSGIAELVSTTADKTTMTYLLTLGSVDIVDE